MKGYFKMETEKFLRLGNGKYISKEECENIKRKFVADVLTHWDEFEQSLTDKQKKQIHG